MSSEWIVPPGLGMVVILSGPSGVGKTTVSLRLLDLGLALRRVVTTTTRAARPGEVCGVDYHFFSDPEFDQALAHGEFLESAMVHGKRYGTRWSSLCEAAQGGYGVLLVIDVMGAQQARKLLPKTHAIFLLPPSEEALVERIHKRQSETEESLQRRLKTAQGEIPLANSYDFIVVNENLDQTVTLLGNHLRELLEQESVSR